MALEFNIRVTKEDFIKRIETADNKMNQLHNVITDYQTAKERCYQFIDDGDSNYEAMLRRIDANIDAAKRAYSALADMKATLQDTVDKMEGMSAKVGETITEAIDAAKVVIEAKIKASSVL